MRRLLPVPVLVTILAAGGLLAGCGDSTADDRAGDDTVSASPSTSPSSSASSSVSTSASSSAASPTETASSAAPLPACDSVWVDGQDLRFGYRGCLDGSRRVRAQKQICESGKPLVTYRNSFWAIAGGPVHQVDGALASDAGWHRALVQCGG